eukprot:PITA_11076
MWLSSSQSGYALNVSSSSHSHEWLIDSGASYHMAKNKAMFPSLNDCNTKNIYVGDDRSLNVVGTGTVHLDNGQFNDVLCVPPLSSNLLSVYQITHSGEGKIVEFSPHDVVIKDLRDPKQILATDDESEDDNPPPSSQDHPSAPSAPSLPKWVQATRDVADDLVGDPTDQRRTRSQFERASSLLAQVSANYDPDTFEEASSHPDWDATMNEEYRSLLANDTWDLVPLPKGRKLVRCKWVYRTKYGPDGKVDKHKARLVAKGFSQVEGIDYTETFSPLPK